MQCCVPFCKTTAKIGSESVGITFHEFPREVQLRDAWCRALGKQDGVPDSAMVCSLHFLNDDIYETANGIRQLRAGAIPSTVQVCMICLDTDGKMLLMSKHKLDEAYEWLTNHPPCDQRNLKQTLCIQCAQRLINFSRFREKSLKARELMMDLVVQHELITRQHITMINHTKDKLNSDTVWTKLEPEHYDMHILEQLSGDIHTELDETLNRAVVKAEGSCGSTSGDEDMKAIVEDGCRNENKVHATEEAETIQKCEPALDTDHGRSPIRINTTFANIDTLTHCVVKLDDIFANVKKNVAPRQAELLIKIRKAFASRYYRAPTQNEVPATEYIEPLANTSSRAKVVVSKPLQSKTDCSNNDISRQLHTEEASFICDICQNMYNRKSVLVKHMQIHTKVMRFTCNICQHKFKYQSHLTCHMQAHTGEQPYTCELCGYKYAEIYRLVRHIRTHTGEKPYSCKLCSYKSARRCSLLQHMTIHTDDKPYCCELCGYRYAARSRLVRHMRTHTGEKPYSCNLCSYKSIERSKLVIHMRSHTGERPYACKLCGYKCATRSALVIHNRTHTGEKPHSCNLCSYRSATKFNLVNHMRNHTGERPYACKLCGYKSAVKSHLVTHMRTHTGEKPYSCDLCSFKSAARNSLVTHMRTHTGEKLSCDLCSFKSAARNSLVRHMKIHTDGKPSSCEFCKYKSSIKGRLLRHMRTHMGEKSLSCS